MHIFGHSHGPISKPVELVFGGEWNIPTLMKALVDLSDIHGTVWFDQLSIPQEKAQIEYALLNMRLIYSALDVITLMPNAPCPCLKEAVETWSAAHPDEADSREDFPLSDVTYKCPNAVPVSSYHSRLWTRQEFAYSRNMSIYYCGPPGGQCTRDRDLLSPAADSLSEWGRWKYHRITQARDTMQANNPALAWLAFVQACVEESFYFGVSVMHFYYRYFKDQLQYRPEYRFARHILGRKMEQKEGHVLDSRTLHFDLFETSHVASNQQDCALAIFPTIDEYRFPREWRNMTLPQLVEDGIKQLESSLGLRVQTWLPAGLFEMANTGGSMRCKPNLYLRTETIKVLSDVYKAMIEGFYPRLSLSSDAVALRFQGQDPSNSFCLSYTHTYSGGRA